MRRLGHLVIFARLPRLGQVKRRLAAGIGALAALRFYRGTAERLIRQLNRDPRWTCQLALTPDRGALGKPVWRIAAPRLAQGAGDLGCRMARPFRALPPGPVIVIGTDIPGLTPDHVAVAFRRLASAEFVIGPATDGGYWLFGARRRPLPRGVFAGVRWSTADALVDTLRSLPQGARIGYAATLEDVDEVESFRRWQNSQRESESSSVSIGL